MRINTNIQLAADERMPQDPDELAAAILATCNGDPSKDVCYVSVTPATGQAGTETIPPPGMVIP